MSNSDSFLFLNIDGVLTSARTYWGPIEKIEDALDPVALRLIEKLCAQLPVKVIIASNWTLFFNSKEQWQNLFEAQGITLFIHDVLPLPQGEPQHWPTAVQHYMKSFAHSRFALLIDTPPQSHDFVVTTNRQVGLTTSDLLKVVRKLSPDSPVIDDLEKLHKGFPRAIPW